MNIPPDLKCSISGIRGLSPGSLTPEMAFCLAWCFAGILPSGSVIISRDSRPSGRSLKAAAIAGLRAADREVLDADLIPLPTTQLAVEHFGAAGAIDITASHNPVQWNGLKFLGSDGTFIQQASLDRLLNLLESEALATAQTRFSNESEISPAPKNIQAQAVQDHIDALLPRAFSGRGLTVAVDAVNGAGSYIIPRFLEALNCRVVPLAVDPEQPFPHTPEPTPASLSWTQERLRDTPVDLAVVVDPDADRLVLIDERNRLVSEECLIPLIALERCKAGERGVIVVNKSTSMMVEEVADQFGCTVRRSAVGEINVVNAMRAAEAFLGGEGCGGVIDPQIHYGRDSLVGILGVLNLLRRTNKALGQLVEELPPFEMRKDSVDAVPGLDLQMLLGEIGVAMPGVQADTEDGLYLRWPDKWLHLRPSNTEPIFRIFAEAASGATADELIELGRRAIRRSTP